MWIMILEYFLAETSICISHLQKSLHPAAGVLRTSSIKPMRKYQCKTGLPQPFVLTVSEENINDYLSSIEEISELGLPNSQIVGVIDGVAILE